MGVDGQLVLVGFNNEGSNLPYQLNLHGIDVKILGPGKKDAGGATVRGIKELFGIVGGIFKNRNVLKDIDLIYSEFREYTFFEVFLIKFFARRAKDTRLSHW